jgi:hypothetical protein
MGALALTLPHGTRMTGLELAFVVVLSVMVVLILQAVADSIVEARKWYRRLDHAPGAPVRVRVAPAEEAAAADYRHAPGDALEIEYPARLRVPVSAIRRAELIRSLGRPGDVPIDLLLLEVMPAPGPSSGAWARGGEVVIPVDADGFEEALAAVRARVQVIGSAARR